MASRRSSSERPRLPPPDAVVARNVGHGMGILLDANNVVLGLKEDGQAAADGVPLHKGDTIVGVDGQLIGRRSLASVLPPGRPSYTLLVRRAAHRAAATPTPSQAAAAQGTAATAQPPKSPFAAANTALESAFYNSVRAVAPPASAPLQAAPNSSSAPPAPSLPSFEVALQLHGAWPTPREVPATNGPAPGLHRHAFVPPRERDPSLWRAALIS